MSLAEEDSYNEIVTQRLAAMSAAVDCSFRTSDGQLLRVHKLKLLEQSTVLRWAAACSCASACRRRRHVNLLSRRVSSVLLRVCPSAINEHMSGRHCSQ